MRVDVSIIIPVYKRVDRIGPCIRRLTEQDFVGDFEIVVVDDGSPNVEELSEVLEVFVNGSRPPVRFVRRCHAGPAATRNYGVRISHGEVLCFIDDDSMVERDWLKEITFPFRAGNMVGVVCGKTCSWDRQSLFPMLLETAVYSGQSWATYNIAYRRDVFESLGGFDESFPEPSWEDNDLGIRARWAGHEQVYNEKAVVYHYHEASEEEYKKKCLLNGRGAALFSRKYFFKRPLWAVGTPFAMSRRLLYGLTPSVWSGNPLSENKLKFMWSYYSLKGFLKAITGTANGKN